MKIRKDPDHIRRYLLGDLKEGQREAIEEQLLVDSELQGSLSEVQTDLIDEYVLEVLPRRDLVLFERNFVWSPERLHKLRLARALAKYVEVNAIEPASPPASSTGWSWRQMLYWANGQRVAVAASALVIVCVLGYAGWRVYQRRYMESRRLSVEQQLAKLNAPGGLPPDASVTAIALRPVVRDSRGLNRLVITYGIDIAQLRLEQISGGFTIYQASIETDEGHRLYKIDNLRQTDDSEHRWIILNLPNWLLPTGSYQIKLWGVTARDEFMEAGTFPFEIVLK